MSKAELYRSRLNRILAATNAAQNMGPPGFWIGDIAGERQFKDDLKAGRGSYRTAHQKAVAGIKALDDGDLEMAELYAWEAHHFYIAALECRPVRPSEQHRQTTPAKKRGRPRKK
jgi:hypothetical protein